MKELTSYNPSNGKALGTVDVKTKDQIQALIEQSCLTQKSWEKKDPSERMKLISHAYQAVQAQSSRLAELLAKEMGKDIRRATGEVSGALYMGEYLAQAAFDALKTRHVTRETQLQYKALGVVAVISPWNYPLMMATNLIVPALMAGNSVIWKPSEDTPLVADALCNELQKSLPEGVLSIAHGDGEVGQQLVESKEVNMIAFTGSKAVGHDIMQRSAINLKRLVMELGGNDPMIVMHNANLEQAARFAVAGSFENSGQMCTSIERIYVDQRVAEQFESYVTQIAQQYQVGPWDQPNVNIGPIINNKQHSKIVDQLQDAHDKGAIFLLGQVEQPEHYVMATVVSNISKDMKLETEETFGPVVAISRFNQIEEAIERANDTEYGLGAVVFGGKGASEVAQQLEAGMVGINQGQGGEGDSPWVGAKQSGYGYHGSVEGHRQFAQVKVVSGR
ncbi:MAG: aldehyde dehydrogenase family protein [Psychromonas sp.]